jgi:lipoprotein signal peptidase
MDQHEKMDRTVPPVKAKKKHIALFVIACVLLAVSAVLALFLFSAHLDPPQVETPEGDPLAIGALLLAGAAYGMAMLIALALFVINWLCGMVIMALLAMERRNKPKWLWGASLGLVILFGLIAAGLAAVRILV